MPCRLKIAAFAAPALLLACLLTGCTPPEPESWHGDRSNDQEKQTRDSMRIVQMAAERFAADHGGVNYPTKMDDMFKSYFPGGQEGRVPAQVGIVNPYNGVNEFPTVSTDCKTLDDVLKQRKAKFPRGTIVVFCIEGGRGYAVVGGDHQDQMLPDDDEPTQPLVFSNRL